MLGYDMHLGKKKFRDRILVWEMRPDTGWQSGPVPLYSDSGPKQENSPPLSCIFCTEKRGWRQSAATGWSTPCVRSEHQQDSHLRDGDGWEAVAEIPVSGLVVEEEHAGRSANAAAQ